MLAVIYIFIAGILSLAILTCIFLLYKQLKGVVSFCITAFLIVTVVLIGFIVDMPYAVDPDNIIESNGFIYEYRYAPRSSPAFSLKYNDDTYWGLIWRNHEKEWYPPINEQEIIRVLLLPHTKMVVSIDRHSNNFYDILNLPRKNSVGYVNVYSAKDEIIKYFFTFCVVFFVVFMVCRARLKKKPPIAEE